MVVIRFYFDEMMSRKVAHQLIERNIDVVMAVDVGMVEKDDLAEHLAYATTNQLVMVTFDRPFATRAMSESAHCGLICWTGAQNDFGGLVTALIHFAQNHRLSDVVNYVFWVKRS